MACRRLVGRFDKAIVCLFATGSRFVHRGICRSRIGGLEGETCETWSHAMAADSTVVLLD